MAGPTKQSTLKLIVPAGEAQVQYSASSLAFKVQNLEVTNEGTLRSVLGPTLFEPSRGTKLINDTESTYVTGFTDTPHGVFHANLNGGQVSMLIVRSGGALYRHAGWYRAWEQIDSGLSSEERPSYPDQFAVLNDLIIWTNGLDQARIIASDGSSSLLGFSQTPSSPGISSPFSKRDFMLNDDTVGPNHFGYNWLGRIGTLSEALNGSRGSVAAGAWYYYIVLEDSFGNLSAHSPPSVPATMSSVDASPYNPRTSWNDAITGTTSAKVMLTTDATLDDLLRQFLVAYPASGEVDNCVAVHIFRTPDALNSSTTPRFVARVPNYRDIIYPDNSADSDLGSEMPETVPVPVFRTMCAHQGSLIIANTLEEPGIVRRAVPGLPGTFLRQEYIYPDSGGAEVTGVVSHGGRLLAFTETSTYDISDFQNSIPLAQGIGCVAPRSIAALSTGVLVWLARDGFYAMAGTDITEVSIPISKTVRSFLNHARLRMAVAAIDTNSREYRCAVPPAGESENTLILAFDGSNWRRQKLGLHFADVCRMDDWQQYLVAVGREASENELEKLTPATARDDASERTEVFVLDRETENYTLPTREIVYRSGWMYADDVGLMPVNVRTMYIGLVDAWDGEFTVRFYRNGSWSEFVEMTNVKAIGVDDGSRVVQDIAGNAVIGTAKTHDPRLSWRQVPVGIENANSWAFEIEATYPTRLHLASFAFDISVATSGSPRGRIPRRSDV